MNPRTCFAILVVLAGCSSAPPPTPPTWPAGAIQDPERKLLELHDRLWNLIGLSGPAALELNTLVLKLDRNIQGDEDRKKELGRLIMPGRGDGHAPTHDRYVENHRKRFALLGISESTQKELFAAMENVWRDLHQPGASSEALERAELIQDLMRPGLPPCQDDRILEYRKSVLRAPK
jgi:hypothetical protein